HTPEEARIVVAIKAGHNAESHNHDDVGSFIVHVDGENLLTDPGPGLYSRQYFGAERRENIFANSYGHSVPRIGGHLQGTGRDFRGELHMPDATDSTKSVEVEFAKAYEAGTLAMAKRTLGIALTGAEAGAISLQDEFRFSSDPAGVEEAFVTWLEVRTDGT